MSDSNSNKIRPIVLCGPSAVGKGTLTQKLFEEFAQKLSKRVSTTTRLPRAGEAQGIDYHFVTKEDFQKGIENKEFIEVADVHGRFYGTTFKSLEAAAEGGKVPIIEFDIQGVCSIKQLNHSALQEAMKQNNEEEVAKLLQEAQEKGQLLDAIFIWIAPPSPQELETRLQNRGTENPEQVEKRLATARHELAFHKRFPKIFDYTIINDDLATAYNELRSILVETYPVLNQN